MKILFISHHKWPHIGGVEKHIESISKVLSSKGYRITTISEENIKPPHIKYLGLLYIWYWLFKNRKLITSADIVHIHDVFIWYLPFKFLFPKKVYITFHGWEGKWPIPLWNIINKKIAYYLSNGSISVGNYINKYYGINSNFVIHGGVSNLNKIKYKKIKNTLVYLGRKDADTGYFEFQEWLKNNKNLKVKYLTNDPNPEIYLKTAEYCVPAGYLSYLEARNYGCKILTFTNNPLKADYWNEVKKLKITSLWHEVAEVYLKLWKS